jgi:hypothetical protein
LPFCASDFGGLSPRRYTPRPLRSRMQLLARTLKLLDEKGHPVC